MHAAISVLTMCCLRVQPVISTWVGRSGHPPAERGSHGLWSQKRFVAGVGMGNGFPLSR
jgi:hypothetical protein